MAKKRAGKLGWFGKTALFLIFLVIPVTIGGLSVLWEFLEDYQNSLPENVAEEALTIFENGDMDVLTEYIEYTAHPLDTKESFDAIVQEHFAVKEENERKTLVVIKGGQGGQSEGSEDRTLDKRLVTQFANARWRGMRIMKVILKNNTCTSVWRWSLTEHTFAEMIEILTRDGSTDSLDRKHDQKIKEGSWSRF